jgi:hypothetical protein
MSLKTGHAYTQANAQLLRLWAGWVVGTSLAGGLSYYLAGVIVSLRAESEGQVYRSPNFMTGDNALPSFVLWGFLILALVGPSVGLAQGLLLRTVLGYENWGRWLAFTSLGIALAIVLAGIQCVGPVLGGIAIGSLQWLILRHKMMQAYWWISAVSVAWLLGIVTGLLVQTYILPQSWLTFPSWPFYPMSSVVYWAISLTAGLLVFSSITGLVLVWMTRVPRRRSVYQVKVSRNV